MADTLSPADILHLEMLEDKVQKQEQQVQDIMEKLQTLDMLPVLRSELQATLSAMQAEMQASLRQIFELLHQRDNMKVQDAGAITEPSFIASIAEITIDSRNEGLKSYLGKTSKLIEPDEDWLILESSVTWDKVPFILATNDCSLAGVPKVFEKMRPRVKMKKNHAINRTISFKRHTISRFYQNHYKVNDDADEDHWRTRCNRALIRKSKRPESLSSMLVGGFFKSKSAGVSQMASVGDVFPQSFLPKMEEMTTANMVSSNSPILPLSIGHQLGECIMHKFSGLSADSVSNMHLVVGLSIEKGNDALSKKHVMDIESDKGINVDFVINCKNSPTLGPRKVRSQLEEGHSMVFVVFPMVGTNAHEAIAMGKCRTRQFALLPILLKELSDTENFCESWSAINSVGDSRPWVKMKRDSSLVQMLPRQNTFEDLLGDWICDLGPKLNRVPDDGKENSHTSIIASVGNDDLEFVIYGDNERLQFHLKNVDITPDVKVDLFHLLPAASEGIKQICVTGWGLIMHFDVGLSIAKGYNIMSKKGAVDIESIVGNNKNENLDGLFKTKEIMLLSIHCPWISWLSFGVKDCSWLGVTDPNKDSKPRVKMKTNYAFRISGQTQYFQLKREKETYVSPNEQGLPKSESRANEEGVILEIIRWYIAWLAFLTTWVSTLPSYLVGASEEATHALKFLFSYVAIILFPIASYAVERARVLNKLIYYWEMAIGTSTITVNLKQLNLGRNSMVHSLVYNHAVMCPNYLQALATDYANLRTGTYIVDVYAATFPPHSVSESHFTNP